MACYEGEAWLTQTDDLTLTTIGGTLGALLRLIDVELESALRLDLELGARLFNSEFSRRNVLISGVGAADQSVSRLWVGPRLAVQASLPALFDPHLGVLGRIDASVLFGPGSGLNLAYRLLLVWRPAPQWDIAAGFAGVYMTVGAEDDRSLLRNGIGGTLSVSVTF